jgi:Protein of unknown function (DUF3108)
MQHYTRIINALKPSAEKCTGESNAAIFFAACAAVGLHAALLAPIAGFRFINYSVNIESVVQVSFERLPADHLPATRTASERAEPQLERDQPVSSARKIPITSAKAKSGVQRSANTDTSALSESKLIAVASSKLADAIESRPVLAWDTIAVDLGFQQKAYLPRAVTLTYALETNRSQPTDEPFRRLIWDFDGVIYTLIEQGLSETKELLWTESSTGSVDKTGLVPKRYVAEKKSDLSLAGTVDFDPESNRIVMSASLQTPPIGAGVSDPLTAAFSPVIWIQVQPDTLSAGQAMTRTVATPTGMEPRTMRFDGVTVIENRAEALETGVFRRDVAFDYPAQRADRSIPVQEIWLARKLGWLPVKIASAQNGVESVYVLIEQQSR